MPEFAFRLKYNSPVIRFSKPGKSIHPVSPHVSASSLVIWLNGTPFNTHRAPGVVGVYPVNPFQLIAAPLTAGITPPSENSHLACPAY
jgi:hypothetical protein